MKYLKYTDKTLLFISTLLFLFGLIMVFSSSNIAAFMRYNTDPYHFLSKQAVNLFIGIVLFLIVIRFSTKSYSAISWIGLIICAGLLLFAFFYSNLINDSKGWIKIASFNFQPSELTKVVLIVWYSAFFELNRKNLDKIFTNLFPIFIAGSLAGLVIIGNDFGTAAVIVILAFLLYILIPGNRIVKIKTVSISFLAMVLVLLGYYVMNTSSFQRQISRFDYMYPCSEEKFYTTGNQVCNSFIAFNNGSFTGKGLGNSTQKYLYLPDSHTDFIFAIVVEELGFAGGLLLIFAYIILLYRIILIGKRSVSSRGAVMCYGIAIYIFLHISVNLLGIMGVIPLTGIPLPFISYGGSFTLCLILALSIVQRVAIETRQKEGNFI